MERQSSNDKNLGNFVLPNVPAIYSSKRRGSQNNSRNSDGRHGSCESFKKSNEFLNLKNRSTSVKRSDSGRKENKKEIVRDDVSEASCSTVTSIQNTSNSNKILLPPTAPLGYQPAEITASRLSFQYAMANPMTNLYKENSQHPPPSLEICSSSSFFGSVTLNNRGLPRQSTANSFGMGKDEK